MNFVLLVILFISVIEKEALPPIILPTFITLSVTSESHNQFSNHT